MSHRGVASTRFRKSKDRPKWWISFWGGRCHLHGGSQRLAIEQSMRGLNPVRERFPINRRNQGLATFLTIRARVPKGQFPINRRHQGLATSRASASSRTPNATFPINRRHQGLATGPLLTASPYNPLQFPINRRHQGLATFGE